MASAEIPEGLVKKEMVLIVALVALGVGFLGGVIFSSFKAPQEAATVAPGQPAQPSASQQQSGPNPGQAAKIANLEAEVKSNPNNFGAFAQLGNMYFDTDQPEKAIAAYKQSLQLNQGQPDVWTDLGVMYRRAKQFKEALAAFDQAISLKPTLEAAYFNKGVVLIHDMGDKAGGKKAWEQVLAINPNAAAPNGQMVKDMISAL